MLQTGLLYICFIVLANVFYVLVQTVWIASWDPSFCCISNLLVHQTSLYVKKKKLQNINIWMIQKLESCMISTYVLCRNWICTKLNIFDVWSSLTSMNMHSLRNIAFERNAFWLLGFQIFPENLNIIFSRMKIHALLGLFTPA